MKSFIKLNTEFKKNVFTLLTGTTIAQVVPFIVSPILSRLYSPDDFGILAIFTSVFSLFSIIVTLQYESAIVLPSDDYKAASLVKLCFLITITMTLFSILIVTFFNDKIVNIINDNRISIWLLFVPIPVFLMGLYNTFYFWAIRNKKYRILAIRSISQSFFTAGSKVILGISGLIKEGLILGTILGLFIPTSFLTLFSIAENKKLFKKINFSDLIVVAREYQNFPKFTAWHGFFDLFNATATSFIISNFSGSEILGLYSFTLSILHKPIQIIGSSISQVYFQKASEIYNNKGNIWTITKKLILRLFIIALLIFSPLMLFGPQIFSFFFGKQWYYSGIYSQLLLPWLTLKFIGSPITSCVNIVGKQKEFFYLTFIYNILYPFALYFLLINNISIEKSLFIVSTLSAFYYIFIILWIKNILNERNKVN